MLTWVGYFCYNPCQWWLQADEIIVPPDLQYLCVFLVFGEAAAKDRHNRLLGQQVVRQDVKTAVVLCQQQKVATLSGWANNSWMNRIQITFSTYIEWSHFQSMEQILQGTEGVVVYLDDLQVTGTTMDEHLPRQDRVLQRLEEFALQLQRSKCKFAQQKVKYLGHAVDKEGLRPLPDKVKAITDARSPTNVTELRAFLGMIQY